MNFPTQNHLSAFMAYLDRNRGRRSALRRTSQIAEACLDPACHFLGRLIDPQQQPTEKEREALAAVALLLANVEDDIGPKFPDTSCETLGSHLADKPVLTQNRFTHLLARRSLQDLTAALVRIVRIKKRAVPVSSMCRLVWRWDASDARRDLAAGYYSKIPLEDVR